MEPLFEVKYFCNRKMLTEFARKYAVGPRWPILISSWVLYLFSLTVLIWAGGIGEIGYFLLFLGVFLFLLGFMPQWYSWQTMKNTKKQNDSVIPETVITFGDSIELHEGMVNITVEYRKIVRTVRLKHSYLLMIGKRNGVMLDPDGFTKGSFEDFKQFLREKRPDLKVVE